MTRFDRDLNAAVKALDAKFITMNNDEVKKALFHLVDFIENTLELNKNLIIEK